MTKQLKRSFVLAAMLLLVASCGGGGDETLPDAPGLAPTTGSTSSIPLAPANLVAETGITSVTLTWDSVSDATAYNIYWSTAAGVDKTTGTMIDAVTSPYNHTGLTGGQVYHYVVTASNANGESEISTEVSGTAGYQLRKAFVTSSFGAGNMSVWAESHGKTGLAAADENCNSRAAAAGLDGTFVAWISDDTNDAYCRVQNLSGKKAVNCGQATLPANAGPWIRMDDAPFAASIDKMLYPTYEVYTPVRFDEMGNDLGNVWMITNTDGTGSNSWPSPCGNWTDAASPTQLLVGESEFTANGWTSALGGGLCGVPMHLLCLESGNGGPIPDFKQAGKVAFVTSASGTGWFASWPQSSGKAGLLGADTICQNLAATAGLSGTFKSFISSGSVNARDRITSEGPWVRLDGIMIAESKADLISGKLLAPLNVTENGEYVTANYPWTGTRSDGTLDSNSCFGWTSEMPIDNGMTGVAHADTDAWVHYANRVCDEVYPIYCLED